MPLANFATLDEVKEYLNLKTNEDDALLERLLAAACGWIRSYTNRDLNSMAYTETLDGTGTRRLCVRAYPVTAVGSITADGQAVPVASVAFNLATLTRTDGGSWPQGYANVTVSYTAGFTAIPQELQEATVQLVAWRYRERDRVGQSQVQTPMGTSITFQTSAVPAHVKQTLDVFRKVVP